MEPVLPEVQAMLDWAGFDVDEEYAAQVVGSFATQPQGGVAEAAWLGLPEFARLSEHLDLLKQFAELDGVSTAVHTEVTGEHHGHDHPTANGGELAGHTSGVVSDAKAGDAAGAADSAENGGAVLTEAPSSYFSVAFATFSREGAAEDGTAGLGAVELQALLDWAGFDVDAEYVGQALGSFGRQREGGGMEGAWLGLEELGHLSEHLGLLEQFAELPGATTAGTVEGGDMTADAAGAVYLRVL